MKIWTTVPSPLCSKTLKRKCNNLRSKSLLKLTKMTMKQRNTRNFKTGHCLWKRLRDLCGWIHKFYHVLYARLCFLSWIDSIIAGSAGLLCAIDVQAISVSFLSWLIIHQWEFAEIVRRGCDWVIKGRIKIRFEGSSFFPKANLEIIQSKTALTFKTQLDNQNIFTLKINSNPNHKRPCP